MDNNIELQQPPAIDISEYIGVLKRNKVKFFIPFAVIGMISLGIAFGLPPVYRSEATILIERQEIPTDLVATTVTGYVQERIESTKQRLLTHSNLLEIAEKLDLYPEERRMGIPGEIVKRMRDGITVTMLDVRATDMDKGRQTSATIAFTVGFDAETPEIAQDVATELSNLFVSSNTKIRSEKAAEVSKFLNQEAETLKAEIAELEKNLAAFKQEQMENLPELMNVNIRLFEQTEAKIERTEEKINSLQDNLVALETELSITNPNRDIVTEGGKRLLSANERLSALTAEYIRASARYSPDHPDLIKMRREIQALGSQTDGSGVSGLVNELSLLRAKLSTARQKYSEDHPDVRKLEESVAAVERGLTNAALNQQSSSSGPVIPPDNPRYISLQTQISTVKSNINEEKENLQDLEQKKKEYELRLFQTPAVERDYKSLSRDYENARRKYSEIKDKQLKARLAENLEAGQKAESFNIVDPANLPGTPDSPNRLGIALLGGFLAFGSGIGAAAGAEFLDRSVRGAKGITAVLGAPPIAVIPYFGKREEEQIPEASSGSYKVVLVSIFMVGTLLIVLALMHLLWMPLGDLFQLAMAGLGLGGAK